MSLRIRDQKWAYPRFDKDYSVAEAVEYSINYGSDASSKAFAQLVQVLHDKNLLTDAEVAQFILPMFLVEISDAN